MGILPFVSSGYGKPLFAKVTTMDADLERIVIETDSTGRQLFDTVCRIIGLREIWYFGLQYTNKKGIPCWLQMDKKVSKQEIPRGEDGCFHLLFLVKFYPEDVEEELIQDLTRHLFFLQIKQAILSEDLYCSAEAAVLLASYAVQAIHGDCSEETELDLSKLLPLSVTQQYDMSTLMWQERIRRWWTNNSGQSREDAEMEYLRVAQDLEMYGIQYYPICNKKETDLQLGVSAQGIGIYKGTNRITPRPFFSWSEIKNISFKNKKFNMKTVDKSTISFRAQDHSINMSILDLCIGTHNLYLRRRQPDLLEVQQMKTQAKEERLRRQEDQARLNQEREERQQAEAERNQLKNEMQTLADQLQSAKDQMRKTEETAELLAEKARASENEALQLAKRAQDAEAECQRIKMSHVKCEETRMRMERKMREAESYAQRLSMSIGELNRRPHYASHALINEQAGWNVNNFAGQQPMSMSHHQLMLSNSSQEEENREHEMTRDIRDVRGAGGGYRSASTQPMAVPMTTQSGMMSSSVLSSSMSGPSPNGAISMTPPSIVPQQMQQQHPHAQQNGMGMGGMVLAPPPPMNAPPQMNGIAPPPPHMNGVQMVGNVNGMHSMMGPPPPMTLSMMQPPPSMTGMAQMGGPQNGGQLMSSLPPPDPSAYIGGLPADIVNIRNELEKSRADYNERTRHFKEKLEDFRSEIEGLKREERMTEQDRLYAANIQRGQVGKQDTLRMSATGSARSRVEVFEGL